MTEHAFTLTTQGEARHVVVDVDRGERLGAPLVRALDAIDDLRRACSAGVADGARLARINQCLDRAEADARSAALASVVVECSEEHQRGDGRGEGESVGPGEVVSHGNQ